MIKTCLFLSEIATRIRNVTNLDIGLFHKKSKQGGVKVCTPPPYCWGGGGGGGGVEPFNKFSKRGGLDRTSNVRQGLLGKGRGV